MWFKNIYLFQFISHKDRKYLLGNLPPNDFILYDLLRRVQFRGEELFDAFISWMEDWAVLHWLEVESCEKAN